MKLKNILKGRAVPVYSDGGFQKVKHTEVLSHFTDNPTEALIGQLIIQSKELDDGDISAWEDFNNYLWKLIPYREKTEMLKWVWQEKNSIFFLLYDVGNPIEIEWNRIELQLKMLNLAQAKEAIRLHHRNIHAALLQNTGKVYFTNKVIQGGTNLFSFVNDRGHEFWGEEWKGFMKELINNAAIKSAGLAKRLSEIKKDKDDSKEGSERIGLHKSTDN